MKRKVLYSLLLLFVSLSVKAQKVTGVDWQLDGNRVAITYTIDASSDRYFDVGLSYILKKDGLTYPLRRPTYDYLFGDLKSLNGGRTYRVYWDISREKGIILNEFDTQMQILVELYPIAKPTVQTFSSSSSTPSSSPSLVSKKDENFYYFSFNFVPMANEPSGFAIGSLPAHGLAWNFAFRYNKNWSDLEEGSTYDKDENFRKQRVDLALGSGCRLFGSNIWLNFGVNWRYFAMAANLTNLNASTSYYSSFSSSSSSSSWKVLDDSKIWTTNLDLGLNFKMGYFLLQTGINFPIVKRGTDMYDKRTLMTIGLGLAF